MQRVVDRLRPGSSLTATRRELTRRALHAARQLRHRLAAVAAMLHLASAQAATPVQRTFRRSGPVRSGAHRVRAAARRPSVGAHRRSVLDGIGAIPTGFRAAARHVPVVAAHERLVPIAVALVLVGAAVFSTGAVGETRGAAPAGDGPAATPRLAIAQLGDPAAQARSAGLEHQYRLELEELDQQAAVEIAAAPDGDVAIEPALLLKPTIVDTTVADGSDMLRRYKVKSGDTLVGIARKFDVSMMSIWWANKLKSKDQLHIGQSLIIPPTSGLVVRVAEGETLAAIAERTKTPAQRIYDFNELEDEILVAGQVLVVPGAKGAPIPVVKPKPKPRSTTSSGSRSSVRTPARYTGGAFRWPVPGGSISQYFHYGHYGIDINGDTGDPVLAAAGGTITFAGWKSNGGGYQVWISHGSGLYTTYNHMSSIAVSRGAHVGRGQRVGRVGCTGYCTGSHLHFEVWKGPIWNGGSRVNPLRYF
jgi:murein DD-endopeptidase MepM/ murein hydrolase activator NlpD